MPLFTAFLSGWSPFFAKISSLPSYYHALRGDRHVWILQCHQIYGTKIRVTPGALVFLSAPAFRDIYGARSNVQRSKSYEYWQRNERDVNTLITSDVALHHKKRRILNLVFTERSIRAAASFIQKHVDRWNELLIDGDGQDWSKSRNLTEWSDYLIFDILCDLCFGKSLNIKEPGENPFKGIPKAIHSYVRFSFPFTKSPFLGLLLWLKPRGPSKLLDIITPADTKAYYRFIEESVAARRKAEELSKKPGHNSDPSRQDMFHFLFQAKDPDTGKPAYSQQELFAEANLLVIAGSDTTAINLCGFFFYITRNPRPYQKLIEEIRSTFDSAHEIVGGPKLSSCRYLRACLDESMRLTPAVPSELSRTILAGGLTIDGEHYPAGVEVGTAAWSTGRSDEFGDPFVYRPERWLVDQTTGVTSEEVARISSLVHPFSAGWGNCVGQNLAILELLTTIARTLYRLDVRAEPGSALGEGAPELGWGRRDRKQFQLDDAYVALRDGPMIQFKKRKI
ncbi:MAG: hypothetical protein Q9188_002049 [Gyalolechia gomerana]